MIIIDITGQSSKNYDNAGLSDFGKVDKNRRAGNGKQQDDNN